jgi:PAS domain S-box-containing protein
MVDTGDRSDVAPTEGGRDASDGRDGCLNGHVDSPELARALQHLDVPLIVYDDQGIIRLANQAAADLSGRSLDVLIGTPVTQFVSPVDAVEHTIADLISGRFDGFAATRSVTPLRGDPVLVYTLAHSIVMDGRRYGVALSIPQSELGRLGRNPLRFSVNLVPVAVGLADEDWTVTFISSEVNELIGRQPAECVGRRVPDMIHPDDAADLWEQYGSVPVAPFSLQRVRFASGDGSWIPVSAVVAPAEGDPAQIRFALVGRIERSFRQRLDRVQELELHLRRIGAELRAAGVLESMEVAPTLGDFPQMGELTSRQWEILSRLLRGERVPTIAKALFVSPSTVRNHLSAIYQKFGVHSQVELLERLRSGDASASPDGGRPDGPPHRATARSAASPGASMAPPGG